MSREPGENLGEFVCRNVTMLLLYNIGYLCGKTFFQTENPKSLCSLFHFVLNSPSALSCLSVMDDEFLSREPGENLGEFVCQIAAMLSLQWAMNGPLYGVC